MAKVKTMRVFSFAKFQAVLLAPVGLMLGYYIPLVELSMMYSPQVQ